jgi:hypothetical protein
MSVSKSWNESAKGKIVIQDSFYEPMNEAELALFYGFTNLSA